MKTCPACRKRIDVQAIKCPYCQTAFDYEQMEAGRKERRDRNLFRVLVVAAALALLFYWAGQPGSIERLAEVSAGAD